MELLLILFPGIPILSACLTYVIFWYETLSGDHIEVIRKLSGNHPFRWALMGIITAATSQTVVLALFFLHFFRKLWLPSDKSAAAPPIILIHGLYHNSSAWLFFSRRLAGKGLSNLYTVNYNSFDTTYAEIVERIEAKAARILSNSPEGTRVALIGHSLGGLAVRGWLSTGKNAGRALAAVTLGTPHKGSKLAGLGFGSLARSLMDHGELIKSIEHSERPPSCPALSLYTPLDNMVTPPENLRIHAPGWQEESTVPVSHVAMLYSGKIADTAAAFIQEAFTDEASRSTRE